MVRVRRTGRTRTEVVEVSPDTCSSGHTELRPGNGCKACGTTRVRNWKCGVCAEVLVDDEHVCPDGPRPQSALRGA